MEQYFSKYYFGGPFEPFSLSHLLALVLVLAANIGMVKAHRPLEAHRNTLRVGFSLALLIFQVTWIAWLVSVGEADLDSVLPFQSCSLFSLVSAYGLLTRNRRIYPYMYFLGGAGALMALISPDIGMYSFPHFVFFHAMLSHALLLTTQVYLLRVEKFQPTWRDLLHSLLGINGYALLVGLLNPLLGTNFLFLMKKPTGHTLLDYFGDWPWYILGIELSGVLALLVMSLPLLIKRKSADHCV